MDTIKAVTSFSGVEVTSHLVSSNDIETAVKILVQVAIFVLYLLDKYKTKKNENPAI